MIEFYGVLSNNCLKNISKKQNRRFATFAFVVLFIIGIIPSMLLAILKNPNFYYILGLTCFAFILNILILFAPAKSILFKFPRKVKINNDIITEDIIGLSNNFIPKVKTITKVKNIIDEGDWYFITFKWDVTDNMVIQKDLITKGTIEEFEKLFEGKIIRKNQK